MRKVISNTSCLISLSRIGKLYILKDLYGEILIPPKVKEEFGEAIEEWIKVIDVKNEERIKLLEIYLDRGEAEVIELGMEIEDALLILDDLKARNMATELGLNITGTIGVILKAKSKNVIESAGEIFKALDKAGFRISEALVKEATKIAEEDEKRND